MAKSISQQIKDKTNARIAEQAAANPTPANPLESASDVQSFVASATLGTPDEDEIGANSADEAPAPETTQAPVEEPSGELENSPLEADPAAAVDPTDTAPKIAAEEPKGTVLGASSGEDEWEDGEIDDDSVGVKYKYKAPKGQAEFLKKGYMRRADYDRRVGAYGRMKPDLLPMLEDGSLEQLMPAIKIVSGDRVLADAVAHLIQQRHANQPLSYYQQGYEPRPQPQPQPQAYQPVQQTEADLALQDPYLQAAVQPYVAPLQQQIAAMQSTFEQQQQQVEQQRQQQLQQQQQRQYEERTWAQIHQGLARDYPGEFDGSAKDIPKLQQLKNYADQAGYTTEFYGPYGRIVQAKRAIDASTPGRVTSTTVPSAAVQSIKKAEAAANEKIRLARAEVANGTVVGGGQSPDPTPPKPKPIRKPDGSPLPVKQAVRRIVENRSTAR